MDHLFIHRLEVLRRAPEGEEDGTPVLGGWEPIEWSDPMGELTGQTFGACRLDTPRDVMVTKTDGSKVTVQKSTVLTSMGFPGGELDRLRVTTALGTQDWVAEGVTEAEGQHGPHHIEVNVKRELNR